MADVFADMPRVPLFPEQCGCQTCRALRGDPVGAPPRQRTRGTQGKQPDRLRVEVDCGKYTVVQAQNGAAQALRYGEPWRDLTGDNLVLVLAYEVNALRERLAVLGYSCADEGCPHYNTPHAHA